MLNLFNYRIEYKQKLNNGQMDRSSHYKQVSIFGDLWMQVQGKKIVRRWNR
jgi:hypothetical protein